MNKNIYILFLFCLPILCWGQKISLSDFYLDESNVTPSVENTLKNSKIVNISCTPTSAKLYLDGAYLGQGTGNYSLPYGRHTLKAEADQYQPLEQTMEVSSTTLKYTIQMDPIFSNKKFTVNGVSFTMVAVQGGTFTMGCTLEQISDAEYYAVPTHQVTLSSYMIGETEVTQELWKAVMGSNPSEIQGDNLPVDNVSWNDCQEFIRRLNAKTGKEFRLPTEAEWEYAARGGTKSRRYKYSGSNELVDVAWCIDNSDYKAHPVGTKLANELGLYDMTGNVEEWCQDWYGDYSAVSQTNPKGPSSGEFRLSRGGCYLHESDYCLVSSRDVADPDDRYGGLRLAITLDNYSTETTTLEMTPRDSQNVYIFCSPTNAKLYLDGAYWGQGRGTYSMPNGRHTLKAEADQYQPWEQTIEVSSTTSECLIRMHPIGSETFTVGGVSFTMVAVQGGTFTMGGTSGQGGDASDDEMPTHQVTLSSYMMGETEVTQALWKAVMGSNPSDFHGDNLPVEQVSWDDCQEFIRRLNAKTGKKFRLPTEAEWEYAARGGAKSRGYKYSGSNNETDVAWFGNQGGITHLVGTKLANELGLYDMTGNVDELCQDWYGNYSTASQTNPKGPSSGSGRVCRGGCWGSDARFCRISSRSYQLFDDRLNSLGLRLVLSE